MSSRGRAAAFLNDMAPAPEEPPPATPDFTARQIYLDAAPGGVDARWAWTQAGGRGARHPHHRHRGRLALHARGPRRRTRAASSAARMSTDIGWRNHGTAVLGEFSGDVNSDRHHRHRARGGGERRLDLRRHRLGGAPSTQAAARLSAGDSSCIELHRPGPRFNFAERDDQRGYIAVEWWPDDFAAIRNAANRGIIVVEAAGNGAENLDDAIYQTPGRRLPGRLAQPVPPREPRLRRDRRRRRRAAARHARPQPWPRPLAARLLELGRADRRPGLGPRGHDLRLRRPAGRHERGPLVHRHLLRHLERLADRRRRVASLQGMARRAARPC